jgi:hypothetical protein
MTKISLDEQITAVETEYVNLRGTIDILKDLIAKGKREPIEARIKEARLINLNAALQTLKWLKANENRIKAALSQPLSMKSG